MEGDFVGCPGRNNISGIKAEMNDHDSDDKHTSKRYWKETSYVMSRPSRVRPGNYCVCGHVCGERVRVRVGVWWACVW